MKKTRIYYLLIPTLYLIPSTLHLVATTCETRGNDIQNCGNKITKIIVNYSFMFLLGLHTINMCVPSVLCR